MEWDVIIPLGRQDLQDFWNYYSNIYSILSILTKTKIPMSLSLHFNQTGGSEPHDLNIIKQRCLGSG
jgi:hypothetical protein